MDRGHVVEASEWSAVREVAERSALALDALPRAIVVVDRAGIVHGWNEVAERFYGYARGDAIGQSLLDLVTPDEFRELSTTIMGSVLNGTPWSGNIRAKVRGGDDVTTFSYLVPLRNDAGDVIGAIGAADDAAEMRHLQQRTADLADHLVLALEAGQLGTWRWDSVSGTTKWDVTMERLFGLQPGTFGGTFDDYVALLHPEEKDAILAVIADAVANKSSYSVEHRAVWPDGTVHWLQGRGKARMDVDGNVIGTIGCTIDVTERKLAEVNSQRRLREAESAASAERLQRERLEFLARLNDAALSATDHRELMDLATTAAVPRLGDWCVLHFVPRPGQHESSIAHADPAKLQWARELQRRYPFNANSPTGVPDVIRTGKTQFVADISPRLVDLVVEASGANADDLRRVATELQLTSVVTVPVVTKRGVVGAMQFVSAESGRHYDSSDVALAEAAAGRVGAALDNAWLFEEQQQISSTLQSALLPAELPAVDGVDVAVRYWAAGSLSEVGGDFYDVFSIGERRWAFVIGDVCGTGPAAAAVTAVARHTIRAAATHGASHLQVLNWVNDAILNGTTGLFCTVLYSTLEFTADGQWVFTSIAGGHPLPILSGVKSVDETGSAATMLGTHGTLIGVLPTLDVTPHAVVLEPGSTVVLHTDGINDVRPPHALDDAALRDLVAAAAARSSSAEDVAEHIGAAIADVLPIAQRDDDMAIVVLRIN